MAVKFNVLDNNYIPERMDQEDAGLDLKARITAVIQPGETKVIPLSVAFGIATNRFVQLSARSSIALRGLYVHIGTIDVSFNGKEVGAIVTNIGRNVARVEAGERIAQAIELRHGSVFIHVKEPIDSRVSKDGYGSSGRF